MTFSQSRNTHRNIATSRVSLNQKSHIRARLERKIREVILSWRLNVKHKHVRTWEKHVAPNFTKATGEEPVVG